jgi:hypothetical protein
MAIISRYPDDRPRHSFSRVLELLRDYVRAQNTPTDGGLPASGCVVVHFSVENQRANQYRYDILVYAVRIL